MEFNSVKECAAYFGVDSSYISHHLNGNYKSIKQKQYYCKAVYKIYYNPNTTVKGRGRKYKPVDVFENYKKVGTYDSVILAANATGVSPATIRQCCNGLRKKPIRGYAFQYNA